MERTLILLKPDCVSQKICGKVIARFEDAGFTIRGCKMIQLTAEILAEHYAHVADKPFYPDIEKFMMSTPVIGLVLEGDNVIETMRENQEERFANRQNSGRRGPGNFGAGPGRRGGRPAVAVVRRARAAAHRVGERR